MKKPKVGSAPVVEASNINQTLAALILQASGGEEVVHNEEQNVTIPINIELSMSEWLSMASHCHQYGCTLEQAVNNVLRHADTYSSQGLYKEKTGEDVFGKRGGK